MAFKIKLKLGSSGSAPVAGPSPTSSGTSSPAPVVAPALGKKTSGTSTPTMPTAAAAADGGRTSTPKIKLVRSESKAGSSSGLANSNSNGGSSNRSTTGLTNAATAPKPSASLTPRIVLKPKASSSDKPTPPPQPAPPASVVARPDSVQKDKSEIVPRPPKAELVLKPKAEADLPPTAPPPLRKISLKKAPVADAPPAAAAPPPAPVDASSDKPFDPSSKPSKAAKKAAKAARVKSKSENSEMAPPPLPAIARVKAEPSPSPASSPLAGPASLPSTPGATTDDAMSDDLIIHDPYAVPSPVANAGSAGPPGPRVPALGASTATGKKLVGGQLQRPFIDALEKMLKELKRRDAYGFFLNPVSDDDAPGYSSVITSPMDFTTMSTKARAGDYKNFDEFEVDVRRVFSNCLAFNDPESIFGLMAVKLGRWTENHLMFYRELIIPGTEFDHVKPPAEEAAREVSSPSRSRSVSNAPSADEDGPGPSNPFGTKPRRTGNGQLGKKRGPYRKHSRLTMAEYFAPTPQPMSSAASSAGADGSGTASNQFVIAQAQGGYVDENGRIRGAGAGAYVDKAQTVVRWWEAGGKRAKTKKELSKIATRRARDELGPPVCPDGSRDLREEETLDGVLDAFLNVGMERPAIEPLPVDFLANTLGRAYTSAAASQSAPHVIHSPPRKPAPLPTASYGEQFYGDRLPEAFSWARPADGSGRGKSPSPAPAQPAMARPRLAIPTDYGIYPFFTTSTISPAGLLENERRDFLAAPVPDPRRPANFFSDPLLDLGYSGSGSNLEARQEAAQALTAYDDSIRKIAYGGWVGEAYADSLETFLADAYGDAGDEARKWVSDHVYDLMFALEGALPLAKKVADVIRDAGGLPALDATSDEEEEDATPEVEPEMRDSDPPTFAVEPPSPPAAVVKQEVVVKQEDVVMKTEREDDDSLLVMDSDQFQKLAPELEEPLVDLAPNRLASSLPSTAAIRNVIRRMPSRRAAQAHLDQLAQLPIFLSSVISQPADFYTEPAPPLSTKRRRSVAADDPPAPVFEDWTTATLRRSGEELLDLIREQERGAPPRKRTRTSGGAAADGGLDGSWVDEAKATRVRLQLLSLARRVPVPLLERLDLDQAKLLFPDGPIGRHFEQLVPHDQFHPPK